MPVQPISLTPHLALGGDRLVVIAGPCVIESIDLLVEVAERAKDVCARLGLGYVFKASFDKANRSSGESFRGPGLETGLRALAEVKRHAGVAVLTDIHEAAQAAPAAAVADVLQIPAFLCRQTDLIEAAVRTGRAVNVKKGPFLSPWDAGRIVEKARAADPTAKISLTERGASFGYNNLVVDMRSLPVMRAFGCPVIFDGTHSVQRPGGLGKSSGGDREFIFPLVRAACAVGIDGLFLETHPHPEQALSDGPNALPLDQLETVLTSARTLWELGRRHRP